MRNFNNTFNREKRNDSREGAFNRRDSGKRQFGNRDRERPQMHEATCSDCGKKCEVPFRPTGDKPVYCSQCFTSHGGGPSSGRSGRGGYERPRFQNKRMFDATCDKCGKRFELPFKPTSGRAVYCKECFDKGGNSSNNDKAINQYKEQFDMLNAKLDRIIKALTLVVPAKEERKGVIAEKKEVVLGKKEKAKKSKKV